MLLICVSAGVVLFKYLGAESFANLNFCYVELFVCVLPIPSALVV
jgi:hypothetical protein